MNFGTASLGTPIEHAMRQAEACAPAKRDEARNAASNAAMLLDCGPHGWLTVKQIAAVAGTSKTAIYKRLSEGARGAELCVRRWANQSRVRKASPPRRDMLVCAFRIATRFPDRLPTLEDIQAIRPMSRQNAQVWRQAIATARRDATPAKPPVYRAP